MMGLAKTMMHKIDNFPALRTFNLLRNIENKYIITSHSFKCSGWKNIEEAAAGTGARLR